MRPTAVQTARRFLILRSLVIHALNAPPRAMLERLMREWSDSEKSEFEARSVHERDGLIESIESLGLTAELTPSERNFVRQTWADMSERDHIDFTWRLEALAVLMWALQMIPELPPMEVMAKPELLAILPGESAEDFLGSVKLRGGGLLDRMREDVEFWHWRSRTREFVESGATPRSITGESAGFESFDDIVRHSARAALKSGTLTKITDEDLTAFGKAYRDLDPQEWGIVRSVTIERHFALNWLCGYAPNLAWDDTPTDT